MTSTISKDTSPLADLVGAADTARRAVSAELGSAAYRESLRPWLDKAGLIDEFADLQPITIRNAGLVLREAIKRLDAAKLAHRSAQAAVEETNRAYNVALDDHRKAEHLLMVSALQPNGGEA